MHGEVPDGAAGKAQWLYDIGIGAEGQPLARGQSHHGRICLSRRFVVRKGGEKNGIEKRGRCFPTRPMGESHQLIAQPWAAAAKCLYTLEHSDLWTSVRRVGHGVSPLLRWCCTFVQRASMTAACAS